MRRRVVLVSLDYTRPKDPPMSLGHASILANLRRQRVNVIPRSWAVNRPNFSPRAVSDFIISHKAPHTDVALGAFVWNEKAMQSILTDLHNAKFPGRIILGGPQVSYVKTGLEQFYPHAHVFIRGYAESPLAQLLQSPEDRPTIRGVHYAGQLDRSISAPAELDSLPSPYLDGTIEPQRFIRWETQRGCPFHCSFCQHRESDITMKRRHFNLSRVIQEAEWIARNTVIQDVAVLDPTFNSGPNYLTVLDKLIAEKYTGKLSLQCRIEMVKTEFLDRVMALNQTGHVVLEFGLQTIHPEEQKMIERVNNMSLVERILQDIMQRRIDCEVSLIFGLPKQTVKSFKQSIEYCKRFNFTKILAFPLMLLRGTELYYQKDKLGLIESHEIASPLIDRIQDDIPHVVASPHFSYADWQEMSRIAGMLEQYNNRTSVSLTNIPATIPSQQVKPRTNPSAATLINASIWQKPNNNNEQSHSTADRIKNNNINKNSK